MQCSAIMNIMNGVIADDVEEEERPNIGTVLRDVCHKSNATLRF